MNTGVPIIATLLTASAIIIGAVIGLLSCKGKSTQYLLLLTVNSAWQYDHGNGKSWVFYLQHKRIELSDHRIFQLRWVQVSEPLLLLTSPQQIKTCRTVILAMEYF